MLNGVIIGVVQGVLEWLPVSSEGAVWLTINQLEDLSFETGVKYALFVHLATVPSAILVFRKQILYMIKNLVRRPSEPDAVIVFLGTTVFAISRPEAQAFAVIAHACGYLPFVILGVYYFMKSSYKLSELKGKT